MLRNRRYGGATGKTNGMEPGMARGGGPSAAQLLLQKASTQLRGERVPIKSQEQDELANYLNSLTQKTSQQAKSVTYEEFGDLSISSGADPMTPHARRTPSPAVGAGRKFLKKKTPAQNNSDNPIASSARRTVDASERYGMKAPSARTVRPVNFAEGNAAQSDGRPVINGQKGSIQISSALNKAAAFSDRISQNSSVFRQSHNSLLDSDTDESTSPALPGTAISGKRSRPSSGLGSNLVHDGNKLLKKGEGKAEAKTQSAKNGQQSSVKGYRVRRVSSNVYLTSEEESLAEFIQELSGSDDTESRATQTLAKQVAAKVKLQPSRSPSPSVSRHSRRQTPSSRQSVRRSSHQKSDRPVFHRMSSQESDSLTRERLGSHHGKVMTADSSSVDEPFELKLMDADTLGPISPEPALSAEQAVSSGKPHASPFRKSQNVSIKKASKTKSAKQNKNKNESSSVLASFGILAVEDLLGVTSDKGAASDESEITTEPTSQNKHGKNNSTSQISAHLRTRDTPQRQMSYSDGFEPSISERIGDNNNKSRWAEKSSSSLVSTQSSEDETDMDYTEDFASETLSIAKDSEMERSSHYRYSDEESKSTQTASAPLKPAKQHEKKIIMERHDVEIQTADPAGLNYQWFSATGVSLLGPSYGLNRVDPTPIAATVINPDALEAMTAYSPATLVIHEMLKQQIELIKQFSQAHERLYHSLTDTNVPDYKYTTLEGTKEFIRKHRQPRLTMKEALKLVSQEMEK